jgi:hypothetical protein
MSVAAAPIWPPAWWTKRAPRPANWCDALLPFAQAGIAVVGLEPSCLLTLRDEALALGLGDAAQVVSTQALLFEEFIAREAKAGRFNVAFQPLARRCCCTATATRRPSAP